MNACMHAAQQLVLTFEAFFAICFQKVKRVEIPGIKKNVKMKKMLQYRYVQSWNALLITITIIHHNHLYSIPSNYFGSLYPFYPSYG